MIYEVKILPLLDSTCQDIIDMCIDNRSQVSTTSFAVVLCSTPSQFRCNNFIYDSTITKLVGYRFANLLSSRTIFTNRCKFCITIEVVPFSCLVQLSTIFTSSSIWFSTIPACEFFTSTCWVGPLPLTLSVNVTVSMPG